MNAQPLDRLALGRTLTRLANAGTADLIQGPLADAPATHARRIGVTGAPGAGKSTLLGHLAILRAPAGRLGVLAIDPSSPKSGGAILGDRIRMDELAGSTEIYIRSLGSRKTHDGLADNLPEMLDTMDRFGFVEVLLETVGVGQAEYAARAQVDTLVLVLPPDSGDAVQAMKAGIMEMADIFVVNKADLPGAQKMVADIQRVASLTKHESGDWVAPVLLASSSRPDSIAALSHAIDRHHDWLQASQRRESLRQDRARYRLKRLVELRVAEVLGRQAPSFFDAPLKVQLQSAVELVSETLNS